MNKKIYFWSPHIDKKVATVKSVTNTLQSIPYHQKNIKFALINVFGEWNHLKIENASIIKLLTSKYFLKEKFRGFINSRKLYFRIFFKSYYPLKKLLKKDKPSFLVIHLITMIPILLFIFNNLQTKLILRISGLPKLNIFRLLLWKLGAKRISHVICPTKETQILLENKKIFPKNKLIYIPDPILDIKKINILKRMPLNENISKPYFLSVGRFTKQKNHFFLLNFFSKHIDYLKDHNLIIIGDGELKEKYKSYIKYKKLSNYIKILDYKENIFNYIYNAKLVLSPSLWEDPGFIMIEAAAVGTPIISSNCPNGPIEFIGKNECGFIYNSNNEIEFKNALDNFINCPESELKLKLIRAKKKAKIYTRFNSSKKLSLILDQY